MIQSKELEETTLVQIFFDGNLAALVFSELSEQDFTDENQTIFRYAQNLYDGNPVNPNLVDDRLKSDGLQDQYQNVASDLFQAKSHAFNGGKGLSTAISWLRKYTKARNFKSLVTQYHGDIDKNIGDVDDLLSKAGTDFFKLLSDNQEERIHVSDESVDEVLSEIQKPLDTSDRIYTGLDIDKILKGFRKSNLIIVGAKTSHGKSAFAQNILMNASLSGVHTGLITMEMSNQEVSERLFAMKSHIYLDTITERDLSWDQIEQLKRHGQEIKDSAGYTVVDESMTAEKLYSTARRLKLQQNMDLLIVDYLQQVKSDAENRERQVAIVAETLKQIATDLDIVVIGLSQIHRNVTKRPHLNQLRESGAIEQWANSVIMLWNPSIDGEYVFADDAEEGRWRGNPTYFDSNPPYAIVELSVEKNRAGAVGACKVGFEAVTQRFFNMIAK